MEVQTRENLRKQKPEPESKKPEWPKYARSEAVLIKFAGGVSYAGILKNLKKRIIPEELGVTVQRIRKAS